MTARITTTAATARHTQDTMSGGATWLQQPPYMLGERPTPLHGGSGRPTFRQVPFVRVSERVESGVKVRKQLRKYLKASSATQHMVAQMHLSDACITSIAPQEVAQSCFETFFAHMRQYNETVGQKHVAASKAYLEMTKPLEHAGKSRKWARDVYNAVQKCVQDVSLAERKMERAAQRRERTEDELLHWKRVLEANEATYEVQPNNPEVIRAYQLAQYRFATAFTDTEAATIEYDDARAALFASIERRDHVVEEATELSQSMEEDRLDTMLIVMNQFVETKVAILQAEIEAMARMQKMLRGMDRDSVIQQYVVDSMQPELTHRHAKALFVVEWHRQWHAAQTTAATNAPANYLTLSPDDVVRVKAAGVSANDIDVIKDFVASCFVDPDALLRPLQPTGKTVSGRHRARFTDASALAMYRIETVRSVVLNCLNQQRTHSLELSTSGYDQLAAALRLVLDACAEREDTKTAKQVMNMIQTFYVRASSNTVDATDDGDSDKVFLHAALVDHALWSYAQYWGNALLLSVGDELSKHPPEAPWHMLPSAERTQLVLRVHNLVFGQVTSFVYHMATFGFARKQIFQFAQHVSFAYELGEDQRIALFASVQSLALDDESAVRCEPDSTDEVHFTALSLADWTSLCGGVHSGQTFRPFQRSRTPSTISDAGTARSLEGSIASMASAASIMSMGSTAASIRDLEEMKSLVSVATAAKSSASSDESWEDLFGAASSGATASYDGGSADDLDSVSVAGSSVAAPSESDKAKRMKKRKNSRKFNDQLRLARSLPLSYRIKDDEAPSGPGATTSASQSKTRLPSDDLKTTAAAASMRQHEPQAISPASSSRRSVDDAMVFTEEETLARSRSRSKRLSKSKSAATIDTTALHDPFSEYAHPAPLPPAAPAVVAPSAKPTSSMDQIKSLAAQMKLRRKTSSASERPPGESAHPIHPSDQQPAAGADMSGVAALRARFEKL